MGRDGSTEVAKTGCYGFVGLDAFGLFGEFGENGFDFRRGLSGLEKARCSESS